MIVNIIGRGEGWEDGYEAPGEHWAINYWHPKADVLFEIHPDGHPFHEKLRKERDNAVAAGTPLITHKDYPFEFISQWYGTDYFGSSTDWLIAHAIRQIQYESLHPVHEIHLWGVSMDDRGDHYEKRCATDFWCGMAMGEGIRVVVHGNSTVMTTADGKIYGLFTPMLRCYVKPNDEHYVRT